VFERVYPPVFEIIDHVLMAIFNAVFRMFLLVELELLRSQCSSFRRGTMVTLAVGFGVYAALEAAAGYNRHAFIKQFEEEVAVILYSEWALMYAHIIYYAFASSYYYITRCSSDETSRRRLRYICAAMVATEVTALFAQVYIRRCPKPDPIYGTPCDKHSGT
jgi:RsiW-degrading membrane proteinase PrsW (M82 family)